MGIKTKTSLEKGKAKGRPKGSINKLTLAFRESLELKGFDLVEELLSLYNSEKFDEKDKSRILFRMMEYSFPKLKDREVNAAGEAVESPTPVNISLTDLIKVARGDAE
jgi:hypothetical protein